MHVLDPKEIAKRQKLKRQKQRTAARMALLFTVIIISLLGLFGMLVLSKLQPQAALVSSTNQNAGQTDQNSEPEVKTAKNNLKTFTGVQFRDLYRSISYPNSQPFSSPPEITGNAAADARIRELAEKRGFVLTSVPVAPIQKSGETTAGEYNDDLLQPLAAKAWKQLKSAAKADGLRMSLVSGYRSPKSQRDLFAARLYATGVTDRQIANGQGDAAVNATLSLTAVPGYSRHHTGYTIDIQCDDGVAFGASACNHWISKNNYSNAKKFGWIPSYPADAGEQGPEPEPWEFVWVGVDALYE